jgi:biopolymer transport protein ExbD
MIRLGPAPPRRRASLTPMIDVVFLLLVFFMLSARFGQDLALPLMLPGAMTSPWEGPPRLVTVGAEGAALNGVPVPVSGLAAALAPLLPAPDAPVILRAGTGAALDDLVAVLDALRAGGIANAVIAP